MSPQCLLLSPTQVWKDDRFLWEGSTENEKLLNEERRRADGLAGRLRHVEEQARASEERLDELAQREREANEKCRDQVSLRPCLDSVCISTAVPLRLAFLFDRPC